MLSGRVAWFNEMKGFGVIHDFEGREIYFHYTAIVGPSTKKLISGGSLVYYDLFETTLGLEASNVRFDGEE